ncbi:MAG: hypothetical protein HY075_07755 [Deltaproteobacteria bacterium]|nr:hypothetical protein [Deltaproteobacteria bacterium]
MMLLPREASRRRRGQGTIELILTFFAFFTIFFMFVQVSLSFGVANFIQYATFISARAFLSGAKNKGDQEKAASDYLAATVGGSSGGRFKSIAQPEGGSSEVDGAFIGSTSRAKPAPSEDARTSMWEQGVTYSFKVRLYMAPLIPGVGKGDNKVLLESQSWLGRDPTEEECEAVLQKRAKLGGARQALFDNGC